MRMIAQFVGARGCDAIVDVGEAWIAAASMSSEIDTPTQSKTRESVAKRYSS